MKDSHASNLILFVTVITLMISGCSEDALVAQDSGLPGPELRSDEFTVLATTNEKACWGQATRVFAQMGVMGAHASEFATPRLGLRNLARDLYDQGDLSDDSMQALGAFVAEALGLSIAACGVDER